MELLYSRVGLTKVVNNFDTICISKCSKDFLIIPIILLAFTQTSVV